jgi:acetoacetyl-CoA synthetase
MAVEVWTEDGIPVADGQGELVCTRPFPSMPVGFWRDDDGSRYRAAYFEHYPQAEQAVWRHGDWVELTDRGGMIFHGRSDATLNPGGVRIGTAEIYRIVERMEEIVEAVVVGEKFGDDLRIALFVRLAAGAHMDEDLKQKIRARIREEASPHHVPRRIDAVRDIPRTVSGKISEIAVRKALHGEPIDNREALANPEALEYFEPPSDG